MGPLEARQLAPLPPAVVRAPRLSIVVPAFNEESRLATSLPLLLTACEWGTEAELIVVDNGSTDRTHDVATELLADIPGARVLHEPRIGKGAAVRHGMLRAAGERIAFMDADLATDVADLPYLIAGLDHADVVVGSRVIPDATVTGVSPTRGFLHNAFRWHARRWAGIGISDPQCGFKAFRREAAQLLFSRSSVNGFGFDVEILLLASQLGLRVDEIPVRWHAVEGSRVRLLRDSAEMLTDVFRVRSRIADATHGHTVTLVEGHEPVVEPAVEPA
jgi:glycosyltransferase involved in cell wall biosynthesis